MQEPRVQIGTVLVPSSVDRSRRCKFEPPADLAAGNSGVDRIRRDIVRDDGVGTDDGAAADVNTLLDERAPSHPDVVVDDCPATVGPAPGRVLLRPGVLIFYQPRRHVARVVIARGQVDVPGEEAMPPDLDVASQRAVLAEGGEVADPEPVVGPHLDEGVSPEPGASSDLDATVWLAGTVRVGEDPAPRTARRALSDHDVAQILRDEPVARRDRRRDGVHRWIDRPFEIVKGGTCRLRQAPPRVRGKPPIEQRRQPANLG